MMPEALRWRFAAPGPGLVLAAGCRVERAVQQGFAHFMLWMIRLQAVLALLGAFGWALSNNAQLSLAALAGGAIGMALTAVSALRVGVTRDARPEVMLGGFYRGMALKMVLALIVFVIVARWYPDRFLPVMTGYAATLLAYWIALWRLARAAS